MWTTLVFIDKGTYVLTEGRNFKTFLTENYAITLKSCYIFSKKILHMNLDIP